MEEELKADIRDELYPLTNSKNVLIVVVVIHYHLLACNDNVKM